MGGGERKALSEQPAFKTGRSYPLAEDFSFVIGVIVQNSFPAGAADISDNTRVLLLHTPLPCRG